MIHRIAILAFVAGVLCTVDSAAQHAQGCFSGTDVAGAPALTPSLADCEARREPWRVDAGCVDESRNACVRTNQEISKAF